MNIVESRFHELVQVAKQRQLTDEEQQQLNESIQYLHNRAWKMALLENFSQMAYETNDIEWHHDICRQIDELQNGA